MKLASFSQSTDAQIPRVRVSVCASENTLAWVSVPCGEWQTLEAHEVYFGKGLVIIVTTTVEDVAVLAMAPTLTIRRLK